MEIRRFDEGDDHNKVHAKTGNRFLLWHGSRMSNWGGILGKGLRIAPPEAPTTGYRVESFLFKIIIILLLLLAVFLFLFIIIIFQLGKGIYLADTV